MNKTFLKFTEKGLNKKLWLLQICNWSFGPTDTCTYSLSCQIGEEKLIEATHCVFRMKLGQREVSLEELEGGSKVLKTKENDWGLA